MPKEVYIASVGLTKVDLTGRIFGSIFDLFAEAYARALEDSPVRSFDALQVGIMDSEEFENRANIAAKVADRLGLTGIPAVRTETASSTGAAAFHEAYYKIASGECETVLVLAGERMKMVTTEVATSIMSKTIDPEERRFGFTMPALIALISQAWFRRQKIRGRAVADVLARLMVRAHALGSQNPLAAFYGRPEPLEAYFDPAKNLPVATPLRRKDCSPICDGAAAVILTSRPQAVRVAGLGSATETASVLDRAQLTCLDATRHAAKIAYWRAGIASPRELEGLVVELHDAFNSLLPIGLVDLGLADPAHVVEDLVGDPRHAPVSPYDHPVTGPRGRVPTNLSGGLKARGHPVGGTGLFQICEVFLQITDRFPNRRAQVPDARIGICHSIGGPGNNNYVTLLEAAASRRRRDAVPAPRLHFESKERRPERGGALPLHGAQAVVEAFTTIHVTAEGGRPVHVALLDIDGRRVFARMEQAPAEGEPLEQVLAGQKVKLLVKDDGDQYFQILRGRGLDLGRVVDSIRRRVGGSGAGGA
ncbi:MAG TPA: beta-ketoacyl synthase N-terminal-like domain-containing protein [Myxococcota bacterium]|nr:beta-ketoacyl synthase N-terminal-like domain-containing protein [Myxococcota bacterium]